MRDFGWRTSRTLWGSLFSAAACLASGNALAQTPTVTQMMYVQPIDVCQDDGTHCAPFNTLSPTGNPSTACPPGNLNCGNPVGFVVNTTTGVSNPLSGGVDITRVLLNSVGIDYTLLPLAVLKSTKFQALSVLQGTINCGLGTIVTGYQSCDLLAITDQNCIATNPNCAPPSPLNSNTHVFNIFFVSKLNPPSSQPGTQIYDLVWVGNNGGAIGGNTFFPPFPLKARTGVITHGLLHGLGADHNILGAGGYNPWNASTNPLGGIVPPFPSNPFIGECDSGYPACTANLMTAGNLRLEPSPACMLDVPPLLSSCVVNGVPTASFSNGRAAQLTTETAENPLLPISQQRYAQTSGFLTPIANLPTTATGGASTSALTNTAAHSNKASPSSASSTSTSSLITFDLPAPIDGLPGDTLTAWILIVNQGQTLGSSPFHVVKQSRPNLLQDVDISPPPLDSDVPYSPCSATGVQCVEVEFNRNAGQGFGAKANDHIQFTLNIRIGGSPITLDELCGTKVVYIFHSGSIITSTLGGDCSSAGATALMANPQNPDTTTPNQVVNPNTLITVTDVPPCTLVNGVCQDPSLTSPADAPPSDNAQVCYFLGNPIPCPQQ